jgi:hypothetical protein
MPPTPNAVQNPILSSSFPRLIKVRHTSTKDLEIITARETEWTKGHGKTTWQSLHRTNKTNENANTGKRRESTAKKPRQDGKFVFVHQSISN